jgi:hypothetical protein
MEMIVYLKVKEEELPRCKEFAFVDGVESRGYKYYVIDPSIVDMQHPIHNSCTCKVVVVSILGESDDNSNEEDTADLLGEIGSESTKKLINRYEAVNNMYNKQNFKLAEGQAKPTNLNGWKEIVVNANIDLLNRVTKSVRQKTYEMLP